METLFHETISSSTIITLGALGGLMTSLSGKLNIGLEGLILISAFLSPYFAHITGSVLAGTVLSLTITVCFSVFIYLLHDLFKADIFITGLATNLFAAGFTAFLSSTLMHSKGTVRFSGFETVTSYDLPLLSEIPFIGVLFQQQNTFDYLTVLLIVLMYVLIKKTTFGLHIKATGLNERTAESAGINPRRMHYTAYVICGLFCGLAGSAMTLPLGAFVGGMAGGRGWIALVAVVLGRNNPLGVFAASIIFGFSAALSNLFQVNTSISPKLLMTIPFMITLLALILYSAKKQKEKEE